MVDSFGLREKLDEQEVASIWDEVAGGMVARHTKDLSLKRGRLTVTVDSAPLRQELSYLKEQLIDRLNERFGREVVREVVLV
ncbi:MAG: DUF721 domain-containing protein [Flavobacteriales bacterium]|nr:DUF721 domain-containing protein [Flavobacteriales bacterium]MCB9168309.1 DUF721 domain-containing protein [Flavobacteriales bacterium]